MPLIMEKEEEGEVPTPVVTSDEGVHFLYVLKNGVYFVGATKRNSNAMGVFGFLHKLIQVGSEGLDDEGRNRVERGFDAGGI